VRTATGLFDYIDVHVEALDFDKNSVITSTGEVILNSTNFISLTISEVFRFELSQLEILRTLSR
jgi:hypothetical protein